MPLNIRPFYIDFFFLKLLVQNLLKAVRMLVFNSKDHVHFFSFAFFTATNALSVLDVDMRVGENKRAHNTSSYKNNNLIVRRHQEFIITIRFSQPFNIQWDNVLLEFLIGEQIF